MILIFLVLCQAAHWLRRLDFVPLGQLPLTACDMVLDNELFELFSVHFLKQIDINLLPCEIINCASFQELSYLRFGSFISLECMNSFSNCFLVISCFWPLVWRLVCFFRQGLLLLGELVIQLASWYAHTALVHFLLLWLRLIQCRAWTWRNIGGHQHGRQRPCGTIRSLGPYNTLAVTKRRIGTTLGQFPFTQCVPATLNHPWLCPIYQCVQFVWDGIDLHILCVGVSRRLLHRSMLLLLWNVLINLIRSFITRFFFLFFKILREYSAINNSFYQQFFSFAYLAIYIVEYCGILFRKNFINFSDTKK